MIVYRELSSLEKDLGFLAKALYGVSYHRHEHYHSAKVPNFSVSCTRPVHWQARVVRPEQKPDVQ